MTQSPAFSLLELLVVVAIIAAMLGLAVPAVTSALQARNIEMAGAMFADAVSAARQEASAANRTVEMRIYRTPSGTGSWQALQLWATRGTNNVPVARLQRLPQGVGVWLAQSPLITGLATNPSFFVSAATNPALGGGTADYVTVPFRAAGGLDGGIAPGNNVITLVAERDTNAAAPANYAAVMINPATAKATVIRP